MTVQWIYTPNGTCVLALFAEDIPVTRIHSISLHIIHIYGRRGTKSSRLAQSTSFLALSGVMGRSRDLS
ncbi:hypothetical protein M378DRAFT_165281 [Amanita muscaria Koide BX008]|uniref:Uncharacterized protein n=1 Tax=Amanita muscaria (strain Koide BX008) TaxID=946122 RepID=A0A0C2WMK1_AMAMK|nr:hypothetical protein M378DRAFT_165281 [Amanita muscaria Koide BX008]